MLRVARGILSVTLAVLSFLAASASAAETPRRTPILVYHRFGPVLTDDMTVRTATFQAQLNLIEERGYTVVPLKALLASLGKGADPTKLPERSVVLTVDDGHRTVHSDLFPLIKRYRLPVTLFIYPSAISNADYALTWQQLAEMKASGLVDVQSHTFWHPNFNIERQRLAPVAYERLVRDQLTKSKAILEQRLGGKVDLLAWPFGIHDPQLETWAAESGYVAAFTIERRPVTSADRSMALPRYIVMDSDRASAFEALLAGRR
jgi:peptidoglycan/xylan/chitin deacetylase (PgdA/CDA1 family)